jgi:ParB family transcriptional regulator, chromosome partitioning protein
MARKNLLSDLMTDTASAPDAPAPEGAYAVRGASKSMLRSVNELTRQADAFLKGEQTVELDPDLIDPSFVTDRLVDEGDEFHTFVEAIRERGQDTPILVRVHPQDADRYMVVFGHRRVRAARELGRKVRAVIKTLDERAHVIAQGQENSARANLTFIERAVFAKNLEERGYDRETMSLALNANAAALSKMVSVVSRIPVEIVTAIGRAPSVGRERWVALSELIVNKPQIARDAALSEAFQTAESDERFEVIAKTYASPPRRKGPAASNKEPQVWTPADGKVRVTIKHDRKGFAFALAQKDAKPFGEWISQNLEGLYESFRRSSETTTGD